MMMGGMKFRKAQETRPSFEARSFQSIVRAISPSMSRDGRFVPPRPFCLGPSEIGAEFNCSASKPGDGSVEPRHGQ